MDTKIAKQKPTCPLYVNVPEQHFERITKILLQNASKSQNSFHGNSKEIVIVLENGAVNFAEIFKHTNRPSIISNPSVGHTRSVIKICRDETNNGHIVIVTDWQGIEIYANEAIMRELLGLAEQHCQDAYWFSENCDFENRCPLKAEQHDTIVWSDTIDAILSAGVYLGGANNFVLTKQQMITAIGELERLQIPILIGIIYIQQPNGVFYRTLDDGWYCKQEAGEAENAFVTRSIKTALAYINNSSNDKYFGIVPRSR